MTTRRSSERSLERPQSHSEWRVGGDLLIVLRSLIASMATLALSSGLCVRRLLMGGSPFQGR
jgi:hypothetical protein